MHILSDFPGRQNNQFFRRPTYRPAMTGRGASLALFLYDIHTGLPDRLDGPICRPVNRRVAHRLKPGIRLPLQRWGGRQAWPHHEGTNRCPPRGLLGTRLACLVMPLGSQCPSGNVAPVTGAAYRLAAGKFEEFHGLFGVANVRIRRQVMTGRMADIVETETQTGVQQSTIYAINNRRQFDW